MPTALYALLGSHPKLSELELNALLPSPVRIVHDSVAYIEHIGSFTAQQLQETLGGTLKLLEPIQELAITSTTDKNTQHTKNIDHPETGSKTKRDIQDIEDMASEVLAEIHENDSECMFSVTSLIPGVDINNTRIKKKLQSVGLKARFRDGSKPFGVSAAVLLNEKITELFLIQSGSEIITTKTVTCQNIDSWTLHDRSRPFADRKRGMLPLKVARMLVNIATQGTYSTHHLYDPFCGAGSILQEAIHLGIECTGSDISHTAIRGTQENIVWYKQSILKKEVGDPPLCHLFVADATQVKNKHFTRIPTVLVTEPFLGKQTAPFNELPNIYKGLYKLYKGAFHAWSAFLPSQAKIVIVLPSVKTNRTEYTLKQLIDDLPNLGYNIDLGPVVYARPEAHTQRHIYIITKQ